eukprot:1139146-Pelagomonas_calceolata.AAC.4
MIALRPHTRSRVGMLHARMPDVNKHASEASAPGTTCASCAGMTAARMIRAPGVKHAHLTENQLLSKKHQKG